MKYVVLAVAGLVVALLLIASELYYEDPADRRSQYQIAEQTVARIGTQVSTYAIIQQTAQALIPTQTLYYLAQEQSTLLFATRQAIAQGTVVYVTNTPPPPRVTAAVLTDTVPQSSTTYQNTTIGSGVDSDGCPSGARNQFGISGPDDDTDIYFSTIARNVQAGTAFMTRWYNTADEMSRYDSASWQADQSYSQTCIYFWIESADIPYTFGTWTVELLENDEIVQTRQFTLCEAGAC